MGKIYIDKQLVDSNNKDKYKIDQEDQDQVKEIPPGDKD